MTTNSELTLRQRAERYVDRNDRMLVQPTHILRLLDQLDDLREQVRMCLDSDRL